MKALTPTNSSRPTQAQRAGEITGAVETPPPFYLEGVIMELEQYMWMVGDLKSDWMNCTAQEALERGSKWLTDYKGDPIPGRHVRVFRRLVEEVNTEYV